MTRAKVIIILRSFVEIIQSCFILKAEARFLELFIIFSLKPFVLFLLITKKYFSHIPDFHPARFRENCLKIN